MKFKDRDNIIKKLLALIHLALPILAILLFQINNILIDGREPNLLIIGALTMVTVSYILTILSIKYQSKILFFITQLYPLIISIPKLATLNGKLDQSVFILSIIYILDILIITGTLLILNKKYNDRFFSWLFNYKSREYALLVNLQISFTSLCLPFAHAVLPHGIGIYSWTDIAFGPLLILQSAAWSCLVLTSYFSFFFILYYVN